MNNIFFFIKNILPRNSPYLIYFIVFNLYPKKDIFHFSTSICASIFIDDVKKEVLKKIYYKAVRHRYKLKRLFHRYYCKRLGPPKINIDLYKTPLTEFPKSHTISLIQNNGIFNFRLTDLLTMWRIALENSEGLFSDPLSLKNPYTGKRFKRHNLYNIYFALLNTEFHIPPLLSQFLLLDFDIDEFYMVHYSLLHDIAINNYYKSMSEDEKFSDIIDLLKNHSDGDYSIQTNCSPEKKKYIISQLDYLLIHYYYTGYSQNPKMKERHKKKLLAGIGAFLLTQDSAIFCSNGLIQIL